MYKRRRPRGIETSRADTMHAVNEISVHLTFARVRVPLCRRQQERNYSVKAMSTSTALVSLIVIIKIIFHQFSRRLKCPMMEMMIENIIFIKI